MDTDGLRPATAPGPGDPRSRGPRPSATWRDVGWLSLSAGLLGLTVVQLLTMTMVLLQAELAASTAALFVGFAITVVWLLTIYWFVMGAWRRSVWGCPFDHVVEAAPQRRCRRHRLTTASDRRGPFAGGS